MNSSWKLLNGACKNAAALGVDCAFWKTGDKFNPIYWMRIEKDIYNCTDTTDEDEDRLTGRLVQLARALEFKE